MPQITGAEFRERMLVQATLTAEKGEEASTTIERAASFAEWVLDRQYSTTVLKPWEVVVIRFGEFGIKKDPNDTAVRAGTYPQS